MEHLPVTRIFGIERCEFAIVHTNIMETVYNTQVTIVVHMLSITRRITCLISPGRTPGKIICDKQ